MSKKFNSSGKAFIASTLGICLLLGGSTYALWSANVPMDSEATITAGDLQVTAMTAQHWFDVTDGANPLELPNLQSFLMVPGDKLQLKQNLNVVIVGDNISGKLKVELPNSTESTALLSQAKFTLKLLGVDGEELTSLTPTTNGNSIEVAVENLPQTPATGRTYSIQLDVELPANADNATKLQTAVLEDAVVTLEQGEKYALPFRFTQSRVPEARLYTDYTSVTFSTVGGTDAVTYRATGVPQGMAFNAATGTLSGKPSGTVGNFELVITATDSVGKSVSQTFDLRVSPPLLETVNAWNFEDGGTAWTGTPTTIIASPVPSSGSKVLNVISSNITNNGTRVYSPSGTLERYKTYKITAKVYPVTKEAGRFYFNYAGKVQGNYTSPPVGQWSEISTFIYADHITDRRFEISTSLIGGTTNGGSARANWYLDDLVVEEVK